MQQLEEFNRKNRDLAQELQHVKHDRDVYKARSESASELETEVQNMFCVHPSLMTSLCSSCRTRGSDIGVLRQR